MISSKKIVAVGFLAMTMGCIGFSPSPSHHYELYVDEGFSAEQADVIIAAATEWQSKLGNAITFSGTTLSSGPETINVIAVDDKWQLDKDCDSHSEIGCEVTAGVPSTIYIPTSLTGQLFATTAKHEIGHSLGAEHIAQGNVMCNDVGCASLNVECGDLREVSRAWGNTFDVNVLPTCQGK